MPIDGVPDSVRALCTGDNCMKTYVKSTFLSALTVGLVSTAIGLSAAIAQEPATNKPAPSPYFRTPLVRDLDLVAQVNALSARVAELETKNADLAKKVASLEAKAAAVKK
jgi:hypothetical protein